MVSNSSFCPYIYDRSNNYPRPEELAWTRIKCHKDCKSIPLQLRIRDKTVGASVKAELSRPETLSNQPSSHHSRRTMASKVSLFIAPPKS